MAKSTGMRAKTRSKLKAPIRQKFTISQYLKELNVGDTVTITVHSAAQYGMPDPQFHGKTGHIVEQRGRCYGVAIRDGGKKKTIFVHPVHLKRSEA